MKKKELPRALRAAWRFARHYRVIPGGYDDLVSVVTLQTLFYTNDYLAEHNCGHDNCDGLIRLIVALPAAKIRLMLERRHGDDVSLMLDGDSGLFGYLRPLLVVNFSQSGVYVSPVGEPITKSTAIKEFVEAIAVLCGDDETMWRDLLAKLEPPKSNEKAREETEADRLLALLVAKHDEVTGNAT